MLSNVLDAGPASQSQWEYSTAKSNYFYSKVGENVKKWLAEIDHILAANNVTNGRKVAVVATYLRDAMADWLEVNKANINWYINNNVRSFIR